MAKGQTGKNALTSKMSDQELRKCAADFLTAFKAAAATSTQDLQRILSTGKFFLFQGGGIEFTPAVLDSRQQLVARMGQLLKAAQINEKQLSEVALNEGIKYVTVNSPLAAAATGLIDELFLQAGSEFELLIANHIIKFEGRVKSLKIGRVSVVLTTDFSAAFANKFPNAGLRIRSAKGHAISFGPTVVLDMYPIAWLVDVAATRSNVREEAKWLIDVALSFIRLSLRTAPIHFPELGVVEPHPIRQTGIDVEGLLINGPKFYFGSSKMPPFYTIDKKSRKLLTSKRNVTNADLIFNPPDGSLAERVAQGLGWLTRGRQTEDRAERLLHFFTAIEALLSSSDKTAPVVQNIARNGAVILGRTIKDRPSVAAKIKKLYESRSKVVHAGKREVLWNSTNTVQAYAELMFATVLRRSDLAQKHDAFNNKLNEASYGLKWNT